MIIIINQRSTGRYFSAGKHQQNIHLKFCHCWVKMLCSKGWSNKVLKWPNNRRCVLIVCIKERWGEGGGRVINTNKSSPPLSYLPQGCWGWWMESILKNAAQCKQTLCPLWNFWWQGESITFLVVSGHRKRKENNLLTLVINLISADTVVRAIFNNNYCQLGTSNKLYLY